jgi:lipopolysaccharide transport system permease protein
VNKKKLARNSSLEYYRDLVTVLLQKEFSIRYKNTILGYAWSVLHPLFFAAVYIFAFKYILKIQIPNYALFLISGVFFWQAFSNSLCASSVAFISSSTLIKKLQFSKECLVLAGILNDLLHFIISIPIIVLVMFFYHITPEWSWLWAIPILLLFQLLLTFGLALIVATYNLFFRDLERFVAIVMMLWFYVTPIIYKEDMIPQALWWINVVNPVAGLVINWRHLFMGEPLSIIFLWISFIWSVFIFIVGYWAYNRLNWKFPEYV